MSADLSRNEQFTDLDALLNAGMEDLDDLPPMGVPPSGHYNLELTIARDTVGDQNTEVLKATFTVEEVNELKNPDEAGEVAKGQVFKEFFFPVKKNGDANPYGIAALKERLKPFVGPAGTGNISALVAFCDHVHIAATVRRTVNKKNEDQWNMRLSDVVLL
jgi:hypothetical protein